MLTDQEIDDIWDAEHPRCEECHKQGCASDTCGACNLDALVMLTDGLIFHPLCLAKSQAEEAAQ